MHAPESFRTANPSREENISYKLQIWTDEPLAIDVIKSDLYQRILVTLTDRGITPDLSYENLFKLYPRTRSFFSRTDMKKQQDKLLASLVLLVDNVRDPVTLKPVLHNLGAKHKGYGIAAKHYPAVGDALLQTFEQYLQEDWTTEVKQAWEDTFQAITQIMLEGADGVR
ncbi:MAG: globin domain-containing protein [Spirulina sp.]